MILCDTNVLIDYWRNPVELKKLNISRDKHSICGIVKSELLHGALTDDEADRMIGFFNSFNLITIDEYDWEFSGLMLQTIRQQGFTLPVTDVLIAYLAIKYDIPVWTKDKHFTVIKAIYPELKLYEPSAL
ncbi:MAG: PIN domain-containing protein [Treponema sp.]|nr:PIN domain-containing protein [Candidatus Treponema scatequi]